MPKAAACPICAAPAAPAHAPFCGRGCKDRDLMRWLGEGYRLPGAMIDPDDLAAEQSGLDSPSARD